MSWLSKLFGTDSGGPSGGAYRPAFDAALKQRSDPNYGQAQLSDLIHSQVSAAMPEFNHELGNVRENAIQRGISTGDLGTSYEGDLASSFQKHIADSVAQQTYSNYRDNGNTYLDLLTGGMDREDNQANSQRNRSASLWGGLFGAGAALFGGGG